jgi:hypothetical protein
VELAALASSGFDERSEFIRFDDHELVLALQSLHDDDGGHVKIFGVIWSGLDLDAVVSYIAKTATPSLKIHAQQPGSSPMIARLAELVPSPVPNSASGTIGN